MKKKISWLLVTCLMALTVVITSCGQARPAATAPATPTAEKKAAAPAVEKPKYGGMLTVARSTDIEYFDDIVGRFYSAITHQVTNEPLWSGDWAKGPAGGYGTNQSDWGGSYDVWDQKAGYVAESWEIPVAGTMVWKIRKGVRWALNQNSEASRLVNGRELTVDDVVFSLKTNVSPGYLGTSSPDLKKAEITAGDNGTVVAKFPPDTGEEVIGRLSDSLGIFPPEVYKKYGNMSDWKVSVGTGPFMLTDFVKGSSVTLVKNPNYWMKDPVGLGKGNQLPYLDGVKILIITDRSTLTAALRTAKFDSTAYGSEAELEEAKSLRQTTPQLKFQKLQPASSAPAAWRIDKPPFNDIRVRRALMMATDFNGINKNLFGGEGQILTWPIPYNKAYKDAYLGLDDPEMPASVKELYTYNPDKAKALLKEAGYPQGFKTHLIMGNTPTDVDYYSLIKDMWAKVGVELELRLTESGTLNTINTKKTHEQMVIPASLPLSQLYKSRAYVGLGTSHGSMVDDTMAKDGKTKMQLAVAAGKVAEANRIHKELMKYVLDQAWALPRVLPPTYSFWWPWVKGYSGETSVGYFHRHFYNWVWLDQDLKKSMGY